MLRGTRLSAAALTPRMRAQEIISNNVSNAATDGFRRERLAFHRELTEAGGPGWPSQSLATRADDGSGPITSTGNPLDVAIEGDGYFVVEDEGQERYTRAGSFKLAPDGSLVTRSGHQVMGEGGPINLPPGDVAIGNDGTVSVNGAVVSALRVVTLAAGDLRREGENLFSIEPGKQPGPVDPNATVVQGHLEASNVEPVLELVEMMRVFREYESNFQAMNTAGGTLGKLIEEQLR